VIQFSDLFLPLSEDSTHPEQGTVMTKKPSSTRATSPTVKADRAGKSATLLSIEALFDALCAQPMTIHLCENCGSEMVNLNVVFFLAHSERSWNIPLPVCPKCDPDEYMKLSPTQAA
jgi:hypothetical protein